MSGRRLTTCVTLSLAVLAGQAGANGATDPLTEPFRPEGSTPTLNFFGVPGLIDLPSGEALPDAQLTTTVSHFAGTTRTTITFQFTPRIAGSIRYVGLQNFNSEGFDTFRDRSFDIRFLLAEEGRVRPAVTIGLQDFSGTGIFASEYIAATKTFDQPFRLPGKVKLTGGLGWGRLGTTGSFGSIFGDDRPEFEAGDTGGEPSFEQWFRGPVAAFGGVEWEINDRFGLKAEYSSDAYETETSLGILEQESQLNFGAEYQVNDILRVGGYWLYGSEIGVSAQFQFNPRRAITPLSFPGPRPVIERPRRVDNPAAWTADWVNVAGAAETIRDAMTPELSEDGITLEALDVSATTAELRISNQRYEDMSIAVGRTARVMARILPPSVETFRITPMQGGLALSTVTLRRTDLERLEFQPNAAGRLLAAARFDDATPKLENPIRPVDLYPQFAWSVGPFLSPSFFDPDEPLRVDVGVAAEFRYRPSPGWLISGEVRQRLLGNIEDGRLSDSLLPPVRTNAVLFAQATDTPINDLFVSRQWKATEDIYARVTAGYLESMFGGVSAEMLWKPFDSKLALGVEANYAVQRDFDQQFGFQDFDVFTGHVSAYYEFGDGYLGQIDVGRYLAGDVGATFSLSREFANGWQLGGFFTLTNVSSEEFGEGSFDKGVNVTIPLNWFTGKPSSQTVSTTLRPVMRDGGARLIVPDRLFGQVRDGHESDLVNSWGRVWE